MEISKNRISTYVKYGYFLAIVPVFFLLRYYYLNDPALNTGNSYFPGCIFHSLTGYHCPGCGSQRAIHDLLNGRILQALQHNFLFIILAMVVVFKGYYYISKKVFNKNITDWTYNKYLTYAILILVISYWILRNIPVAPFCYLAP
ncbi:DUF2752 domain-containing protein [Aquimarina sp. 2201CG14-23]|uniref:DUF2752 domain-containing protein n=1 Tax=Aquimarina mycalae TaxID=3040073 RepID=UPI002477F624|nr:DUF2752 domain-containing protein [Aquimarina sp. 2201CG14-23]MDH7446851.1 DUF2752 domain-containing protein [Aquimarina sp. 2201CG14-23]